MSGIVGAGEVHMISRAVRERWPMDAERRKECVNFLHGVIESNAKPKTKIVAIRVLVMMDRVNLLELKTEASIREVVERIAAERAEVLAGQIVETRESEKPKALEDRLAEYVAIAREVEEKEAARAKSKKTSGNGKK